MAEIIKLVIQNQEREMRIREFGGKRVVTLRDIDELHERPDGTARRNFNENRKRFVDGVDCFVRNSSEAWVEFGVTAPNGLVLLTESGYLLLVKSFNDDRAWDVQRQLINAYFAVQALKTASPLDLLELQLKALREQQTRLEALEAKNRADDAAREAQAKQIETLGHRVTNLDLADIKGTPRQRLVAMIKRYAWLKQITYPVAWHHFDTAFSTAFRINLTARRQNYARTKGVEKVDRPEYLEVSGLIEDAIRVASKMLDADGQQVTA